jgi:hypothetical protein
MSSPRDPCPDLSLERLDGRDGRRPPPLGETALVAQTAAAPGSRRDFQAAYEALINAVFTAPGAAEWLVGLRRAVAAMLAGGNKAPRHPVQHDAIRQAGPGLGGG